MVCVGGDFTVVTHNDFLLPEAREHDDVVVHQMAEHRAAVVDQARGGTARH